MNKSRKFMFIVFALVLALFTASSGYAASQDMWANVYRWAGGMSIDGKPELTRATTGITFQVLAVGTDTAETLTVYGDDTATSLTNPVSTTNFASDTVCKDRVAFRVDPTDASNDRYVDLVVTDTVGGYTRTVENFDKYTHTIIIDERPNIEHHGMIWFTASSAAETDTGINFDYGTMIGKVAVEVTTLDATETIDVGLLSTETGGDADSLLDGVSVAATGRPVRTLATSGASMDDGTNFFPDGHYVEGSNANSLTYTGSSGSDTAAGYIHYWITKTRR